MDAVCVCSPSGPHGPQATAAARAGKHVLVEKPMALTLAEADEAIDAARTAGVVLGVALQRRTEPAYQALQAAIADGALGRTVLATVTVPYLRTPEYYAATPWRATWAVDGGGVLINQAIHLADLLLWMCGDVREVRATAATVVRAIEAEDTLTASLAVRERRARLDRGDDRRRPRLPAPPRGLRRPRRRADRGGRGRALGRGRATPTSG